MYGHTHAAGHRSEDRLWDLALSFYNVGSQDRDLGGESIEPSHQPSFKSQDTFSAQQFRLATRDLGEW